MNGSPNPVPYSVAEIPTTFKTEKQCNDGAINLVKPVIAKINQDLEGKGRVVMVNGVCKAGAEADAIRKQLEELSKPATPKGEQI